MDFRARPAVPPREFTLDDLVSAKGSTTISVVPARPGRGGARSAGSSPPSAAPGRGPAAGRRDPRRRRPLGRRHRRRGRGGRRPGRASTADPCPSSAPGTGKGEAIWKGLAASTRRPRRVVRRRHHRLRHPLRRRPRSGPCSPTRRCGSSRASTSGPTPARARDRRAHDRARGPPGDLAALPSPDRHRPAAVGRVRRPPRRARGGARSCRATASTSGC